MEQRGSILSSSTCAFICERIALNMLYPAFRTCMTHSHLDQNRWNFEVTLFHIESYGQSIELWKVDRPIIKPIFPQIFIISVTFSSELSKRNTNQQYGLQNFVFDWSVLMRQKFDITIIIPFSVQPKIIKYLDFAHIFINIPLIIVY